MKILHPQKHAPWNPFILSTSFCNTNTLSLIILTVTATVNVHPSVYMLPYCRFLYVGTWELVNLFVGTKNFSYHIFYENIAREHNKILWSQEMKQTDQEETDLCNMLVNKNELNEINKEGTFPQGKVKQHWR